MPTDEPTLIPSDEPLELAVPTADIDADDTAVINAQAAIEKDTIDWAEGFRKFQNFEVAAYFERVSEDSLPMQSQKDYWSKMTTITEDDGIIKAIGKFMLFDRVRGSNLDALSEVYPLPLSTVANIGLRGKPQLSLYFVEVNYSLDSGRDIADGQIEGNRLMNYTTATLKESDLIALGEKIRDSFKDFLWEKGKNMLSYSDPENGYNLQILCRSKDGGLEVLTKVLALREHEVLTKRVNYKENSNPDEAYPDTQQQIEILGKNYKAGVKRPECTVKIRAAYLHIEGLLRPRVLYSASGRSKTALVSGG
jgi:hypothetical protein